MSYYEYGNDNDQPQHQPCVRDAPMNAPSGKSSYWMNVWNSCPYAVVYLGLVLAVNAVLLYYKMSNPTQVVMNLVGGVIIYFLLVWLCDSYPWISMLLVGVSILGTAYVGYQCYRYPDKCQSLIRV